MTAKRIDLLDAHDHLELGALLVCAYDDKAKFERNHLDDAISLSELQSRESDLGDDQEIVFYCA